MAKQELTLRQRAAYQYDKGWEDRVDGGPRHISHQWSDAEVAAYEAGYNHAAAWHRPYRGKA